MDFYNCCKKFLKKIWCAHLAVWLFFPSMLLLAVAYTIQYLVPGLEPTIFLSIGQIFETKTYLGFENNHISRISIFKDIKEAFSIQLFFWKVLFDTSKESIISISLKGKGVESVFVTNKSWSGKSFDLGINKIKLTHPCFRKPGIDSQEIIESFKKIELTE